MSQTFCPIPWIFQAVRSNGDVRVCCQANVTKGRGVLRKADNTPYNAGRDGLASSRNSKLAKDIRKKMLSGQWHESCGRCRQEEESHLNSRRSYENEQWNFSINDAQAITNSEGTLTEPSSSPVTYYDLRFGNLCNLACRMCGPADSSAWYSDWVKLNSTNQFNEPSGPVILEKKNERWTTNSYDWHKSEIFWEELEKNLENIQHIYMAGGEPLLIKKHYDFLKKCVDNNKAKNIVLEYNTNCTEIPKKAINLWGHFKNVRIGASIDGFGKHIEYQRYPAKWLTLLKNLQILNQLDDKIISWLAYTVTAYNLFHIIDFMKWKLIDSNLNNINRTKRRPIITHHVAHNPKHLNIRVLPEELKTEFTHEMKLFFKWVRDQKFPLHIINSAEMIGNSILNYMNSESYNDEYWSKFCDYTTRLDVIRKQNFLDIEPRFALFMEKG